MKLETGDLQGTKKINNLRVVIGFISSCYTEQESTYSVNLHLTGPVNFYNLILHGQTSTMNIALVIFKSLAINKNDILKKIKIYLFSHYWIILQLECALMKNSKVAYLRFNLIYCV